MLRDGDERGGFGEANCCCEVLRDLVVGGDAVEAWVMELRSGAMIDYVAALNLFVQSFLL